MVTLSRRPNPVFSPEYRALVRVIIRARTGSGLSQRDLALKLGKSNSHVSLIETGQRRVDVLELYYIARALGIAPGALFGAVAGELDSQVTGGVTP